MSKIVMKSVVFASLTLAGTSAAFAQQLPSQPGGWQVISAGVVRGCDASACFTYWNVGGNNWVLISVEPRTPPGGKQEY